MVKQALDSFAEFGFSCVFSVVCCAFRIHWCTL